MSKNWSVTVSALGETEQQARSAFNAILRDIAENGLNNPGKWFVGPPNGFYSISPPPPEPLLESKIAQEVAKSCTAENCSIKIRKGEETTMGWHGPEYDKNGIRTDPGDPNRRDFHVDCRQCGKKWTVRAKHEQIVRVVADPLNNQEIRR